MLPTATALRLPSPPGVIGSSVRRGVDPLLIGSALHLVESGSEARFRALFAATCCASGFVVLAGFFQPPARFPGYYGFC